MIPRRTITLYPGMWKDALRFLIRPEGTEVVERFEEAFALYIGTRHAVATGSGTDAMLIVLDGLGLGPGDHILSTAYTIRPLIRELRSREYDLELLDVSTEDFNVSVKDIKRKIRSDTRAVIVTHIFGTPARMDDIKIVLDGHDCALIEDAAHAHGATYKGRRCGALADAAFFSFDQIKPLSTFGGGIVTTNDDALAEAMNRMLSIEPIPKHRFSKVFMGYIEHTFVNSPLFWLFAWMTQTEPGRRSLGALYRMIDRRPPERNRRLSAMQARFGLRQLEYLPDRLEARRRNATYLTNHLRDLVAQKVPSGAESSYHKFTCLAPKDALSVKKKLFRRGIDAGIRDDVNDACYLELNQRDDDFPGTKTVYQRLLELPGYETLSRRRLKRIAHVLSEIE